MHAGQNKAAFTLAILAVLASVLARERRGFAWSSWATFPGTEEGLERSENVGSRAFSVNAA